MTKGLGVSVQTLLQMTSLHAEQEKLTQSINTWGHLWSAQNRISSDCIKYHFFLH